MRHFIVAVTFLLLSLPSARAEIFDVKNIPDEEKFTLRFIYKGIDINHPAEKPYVQRYQAAEAATKAVYWTHYVGTGSDRHLENLIIGTSGNGFVAHNLFKFKPGPRLTLTYAEKTVFTPAGKKIRTEAYDLTEQVPTLPKDLTHPFTLPLVIRGMDFVPGVERKLYVWFNPTMVFAMKIIVKGEEDVTVPAGTFKCHRLEASPDLVDFVGGVLGKLLKPMVASYGIWVEKAVPHRLIKYHGPFGMVNISGPTETFELVKFGE